MPLYELFCLAKPALGKQQLGEIIKAVSRVVLDQGGVLTDIKSFGERPLAYFVRKPGEKYGEAAMWQLTFAANPHALPSVDHALRVEERVLRWAVLKRRPYEPLPNPFRVSKMAKGVAANMQQAAAATAAAAAAQQQ